MICLFLTSLLLLISSSFVINKTELGVRNINVEDVNYDMEYLKEKYDIYNEKKDKIEIKEVYDSKNDKVSNNSLEDDYKVEFDVYVNKTLLYFTFGFTVYENGIITLTSNVEITIIEYNNEYYFKSDKGYITPCSEVINESNVGDCAAYCYACYGDTTKINLLQEKGGSGGGSGALYLGAGLGALAGTVLYVVAASSANSSGSVTVYTGNSSTSGDSSSKGATFDRVLSRPNIKERMNEIGLNKENVMEIIKDMTNCSIYELEKFPKKVMAIGRDLAEDVSDTDMRAYQNYARENQYLAFFSKQYGELVKRFGYESMQLANEILIIFCALDNWDFVLVTNPYHYMLEHFTGIQNGYAYRDEIAIIRGFNYNVFKNVSVTWETIPCPGFEKLDYFEPSFYYVSKE